MSKILIIGTGPVAIQLANLCHLTTDKQINMVGRASTSLKSKKLFQAYQRDNYFEVTIQNDAHKQMAGRFQINHLYADIQDVEGIYDTIIMACTADAYHSTLAQLSTTTLEKVKRILLVSPTFGSQMIVEQHMANFNKDIEVISFSTYLGDSRLYDTEQPNHVVTTGVKSKLYVASNLGHSATIVFLKGVFEQFHIFLTDMPTPLHAETRNSSLYVHPPLFMNDFSLKVIFEGTEVPVYVYKLFPEGPITMTLIHEMRLMWTEMMTILAKFSVPSVNLLEFMVKENYPVRPETLADDDVYSFEKLPAIHQEYLLYVRYTAILIDQFSEPDQHGRYFDFSAVPIKQLYENEQGVVHIPRMPSEDYYRTSIIQHIGKLLGIKTPMIDTFMKRYEQYCQNYKKHNQQLSSQFNVNLYKDDKSLVEAYLDTKGKI
ncbi:staphylopine biosynthesis dehydrogenase [Staphylococcus pseudoxylosus]|uniref:staphylopine biosynthesis dehydrogenase n=1 Tax=Staphylococcus pseudoxylosus TaxID=2282419 RepID=UPI002DBD64B4|nr:staphylopine biosynthesis dehydrogenase [Staphylococcus pseudoxylosus]MEB6044370.1 staphylopine biosynthesis dehydrogenase [Staphylococcus pseudoxylosus]MEB8009228.1 staphylopine biosynthesis dehydrogenase [Staphylococcus pseudoxylosus]